MQNERGEDGVGAVLDQKRDLGDVVWGRREVVVVVEGDTGNGGEGRHVRDGGSEEREAEETIENVRLGRYWS